MSKSIFRSMLASIRRPTPEPSETDWGTLRSPFDTEGDGNIPRIAVPANTFTDSADERDGLDNAFHPGHLPKEDPLSQNIDELSPTERDALLTSLLQKEKDSSAAKDLLALEKDRFGLEKDKSKWALMRHMVLGFSTLVGAAFLALTSIAVYTSIKAGTFTHTAIVTQILTTFGEVLKVVFSSP